MNDVFEVYTEGHFHGVVQVQATNVKVPLGHFLDFTINPQYILIELKLNNWVNLESISFKDVVYAHVSVCAAAFRSRRGCLIP